MPWGAIAGAVVGGLMSKSGAEDQNEANWEMTQAQMDFQERMSNTAHQREVKDLRLAGLNPILSSKYGGASTPGGATANMVNTLEPAISTAQQVARLSADLKQIKSTTSKTKQEEYTSNEQEKLNTATAANTRMNTLKSNQEIQNIKVQNEILQSNAKAAKYDLAARKNIHDLEKTDFGKYMRYIDKFGQSLNPFTSSAKDVKSISR